MHLKTVETQLQHCHISWPDWAVWMSWLRWCRVSTWLAKYLPVIAESKTFAPGMCDEWSPEESRVRWEARVRFCSFTSFGVGFLTCCQQQVPSLPLPKLPQLQSELYSRSTGGARDEESVLGLYRYVFMSSLDFIIQPSDFSVRFPISYWPK